MPIILNIALVFLLVLTFLQDKKHRSVHVLIFIGLGAISFAMSSQLNMSFQHIWMNVCFVGVVMAALFLYISLKEQKLTNIFKSHFGIGDLVFFLVVSPLFFNQNFILFFITGIVFSGLLHVLMSHIKQTGETIPLAGYLALYLIFLKVTDLLLFNSLFDKNLI